MNAEPLQVYGDGSAQYIEHAARLEVQAALAQHQGDLRSALRLADDTVLTHPPGLHLITLLATRLSGDSAEASLWTAPLWLLLLALALAWTTSQLARSPRAGSAAFLGTLLLPAAHGAATRVHYDLPMTALLWAAVATLIWGVRSRPVLGGLLTATLVVLASQIKWTALPFGLFMLGGAWFSALRSAPSAPLRRAITAATLALGASGGLLLAYLSTTPSSFSAGSLALGESLGGPERLPWYLLSLVTAVFSPLGTLLLVPLVVLWVLNSRRAATLITSTTVGHLVFLVLMVARPDERFLLTLAPALVLAAALGWSELPALLRKRVGGVALAVLTLIAVEFHGAPREFGPAQGSLASQRGSIPAVGLRGVFLADSFERRGWSSRATTPSDRSQLREDLWAAVARSGVAQIAVEAGPSDRGDTWWLRYRSRLDQVRGLRTGPLIALAPASVGSARFWWPHPDTIPDSPTHFEPRGFSLDWNLKEPASGQDAEQRPREAMTTAGISPNILYEFQPRIGLAQVPLSAESNFHSGWTLIEELVTDHGPTVALLAREARPVRRSPPSQEQDERAPFDRVLTGPIRRQVFQVRWGHLDDDGRADLATANTDQPNDVYSVRDGALVLRWSSPESDPSQGVAWGDFDGDGDDDLAVANMGAPSRLYRNDDGDLSLFWSTPTARNNKDVAWADVDGDGDLDLLFAGVGPNQLWLNQEGALSTELELPGSYETDALLLVDLDADGDLDLITANSAGTAERDQIQRWDEGAFGPPHPFGPAQRSSSVAWLPPKGDAPGTLAISRPNAEDVLVLLGPAATPEWTWADGTAELSGAIPVRRLWGSEGRGHAREVRSVAFDSDGEHGLLWAVQGEVRLLRRTPTSGGFEVAWTLPQEFLTEGIDVGDANGDGLPDLAVGNRNGEDDGSDSGAPVQVYLQRPPPTEQPLTTLRLGLRPGSSFELVLTPNKVARCGLPERCTADYLKLAKHFKFPNPPLHKTALESRLDRIRDGAVGRGGATESEAFLTPLIRQELGIAPLLEGLHTTARKVEVVRSWREPSVTGYDLLFEDPLVGQWRAILLLPDDPPERGFPGLLGVHGHADGPEDFLLGQHGAALARSGLAVLVHEQRASAAGRGEDQVARALLGAGGSLMAVRIYESLVGLEFLRALSEVDSERLALVGHSGGSLQNLLTVRLTQGFAAHINDGRAEYSSWDEGLIADETLPGLYPHSDSLSRLEAIPTPSLRLGYGYPRGPGPILEFLGKTLGYVSPPGGGPSSPGQPPQSP